ASELGLVGAAATRCEGGGASGQLAVHAGVRAIRTGGRHVLVLGVDASASSLSGAAIRDLYGYSFDAWTDGMSGVTATALYALSYQAFAAEVGTTEADLAAVTRQNRANALNNPGAHLPRDHSAAEIDESPMIASPYRRLHCSPLSDGAAAVVLSRTDALPAERGIAPVIIGIGSSSDHMHLGARADMGRFSAKTEAMRRAATEAEVTPRQINVVELYDSYAGAQLQALDALGLSDKPGDDTADGAFALTGRCPVNLSGGLMGQGAPVGAIGVGQTATCALLLEGRYHQSLQPKSLPRYALADTHGGLCTLSAATILKSRAA
ncbi:MAG: thiolase family protein, partial [Pseudomonadota bacterium]